MTFAELQSRVETLTLVEQLELMESLAKTIRARSELGSSLVDWQLDAMAQDPDIRREIALIQREFATTELDGLQDAE